MLLPFHVKTLHLTCKSGRSFSLSEFECGHQVSRTDTGLLISPTTAYIIVSVILLNVTQLYSQMEYNIEMCEVAGIGGQS
uniref:Uncharacterized protein n=1 Tax=Dicentrarchus labrax TaxID=13489 RepID=A0A8C4GQV0_DICLA